MLNPQTAWELIRKNALKALRTNMEWHSLVQDKRYKLRDVLPDRLIIIRLSGGKDQELTEERIIAAVNDLNANNGQVQRRHLISPTVAEETAFVLFHPQLTWDNNGDFIIEM